MLIIFSLNQTGFLVWLNTFAGPIFFSLASPLLVFWPRLSSGLAGWMVKKSPDQQADRSSWQGDFTLFNNSIHLKKSMFRLSCGMIFIASCRVSKHCTPMFFVFFLKNKDSIISCFFISFRT